ncbi:Ubiquitin carboxyl-terminal hydrolase 25 [Trebouxia sp. C0009 RCD-2024]
MRRRSFDHADPSELLIKMLEAITEGGAAQKAFINHLLGSVASLHSRCEDCSTKASFQEEHICRLPLLDSSGEVCSDICSCLDRFVAEDRAEGDSDCDVCSRKTIKLRRSRLYSAPNVLVCQMPITDKLSKNMRQEHIEVFEQLSLTKYMHSEAPELKSGACLDYDLVGVIVHCGKTFEGGHYFSYCRRQAADGSPGQWTKFDDEKVCCDISWDEVAASRGYLYLYNRRQPRQQPIPCPPNYTTSPTGHPLPPCPHLPLPPAPLPHAPLLQAPSPAAPLLEALLPQGPSHPPLPCPSSTACRSPDASSPPPPVQQPAVPPSSGTTASEAEVFEVEQILDHKPKRKRRTDHKVKFLIKWVGYGQDRNSWEPYRNLKGAPDALKDYWAKLDSPKALAPSPSPSLPLPEDPPASPVASQLGACPPPCTTTVHSPAHPTQQSPLPPAAAPTTRATSSSPHAAAAAPLPPAPAPPLCTTGVVPNPSAPLPSKPTITNTRSGSQRPAASSPAGLPQAKAPAASTHRGPTKPLATSSSAAVCRQPAPGASTQGPQTRVAAHHHQRGLKPMRVSTDHHAMTGYPPPSPTVSSSSAVEKRTASKPTRSNHSMEDFPDTKPLWEIASELLECRQHLGKKRKAPAAASRLKTHRGLPQIPEDVAVERQQPAGYTSQAAATVPGRVSRPATRSMSRQASSAQTHHAEYDTAISSPAPKRSKVQHHTQAAGPPVAVAKGKRKRAETAATKDTGAPAAKRQDSSDTAALPDKPGLRGSTRPTKDMNYCEQGDVETGMAAEPEVITRTEVPRRKRTTVGKKGICKPWR